MKSVKRIAGYAGVLLACAATGAAWAGAPDLISYQGRLQENGALVNGNRSVNIRLCDALTGGTCYPTGSQGVAVANGIFRTTFTTTALPAGGLNSGSWFIEVMVSGNALSPREQFASAPYALVSSSVPASGIAAGVVGAGVHFGANVGIGTILPSGKLHVIGEGVFQRSGNPSFILGLDAAGNNRFAINSDPGPTLGFYGLDLGWFEFMRVDNAGSKAVGFTAGNVGIGTTNPSTQVEMAGTTVGLTQTRASGANQDAPDHLFRKARGSIASPALVASGDYLGSISFNGYDGAAYQLGSSIRSFVDGAPGANDMPGRLQFFTTPDGSAVEQERMRITSAGSVGIGITNPAAPLNVVGPAGNAAIFETPGFNQVEMRSTANTPQTVSLSLASWSPSQSGLRQMAAIDTVPGGHLVLKTTNEGASGGTARLTVAAGGSVGIGLTSPSERLHVNGGHISVTGTTPALNCGAPAGTITGNDVVGRIVTGGGSPPSCVVTFASAWTNPPLCTFSIGVEPGTWTVSTTPTTMTFTKSTTINNGAVINYICLGI